MQKNGAGASLLPGILSTTENLLLVQEFVGIVSEM